MGDTFHLVFKVKIDPSWHIYSANGKLTPTSWKFNAGVPIEAAGMVEEPKPLQHKDEAIKQMQNVAGTVKAAIEWCSQKNIDYLPAANPRLKPSIHMRDLAELPDFLQALRYRFPQVDAGGADKKRPPKDTSAEVIGQVDDGAGVQAFVVRIDGTTDRPDGRTYHITWSIDHAHHAHRRVLAERTVTKRASFGRPFARSPRRDICHIAPRPEVVRERL